MNTKTIMRMSDTGAVALANEICDGLKAYFDNNQEAAKDFLLYLVPDVLEPLAQDDFFGTEGWEHGLGVED